MPARQQLSVHSIFANHMILQRGIEIPIFGCASPNQEVTVSIGQFSRSGLAAQDGTWLISLAAMDEGGPLNLTISTATERITVSDVYLGELWLCSGQSNMDQRVAKGAFHWCGVPDEQREIVSADYPLIRLFSVRLQLLDQPSDLLATKHTEHRDLRAPPYSGRWDVCSPATVGTFSAAAYFFARELFEALKSPIGIITSCYGASTAQAWISKAALQGNPQLSYLYNEYEKYREDFDCGLAFAKYQQTLSEWKVAEKQNKQQGVPFPRHLHRKPKPPRNPRADQHSPSVLYNGMIAPLKQLKLRGVIWYQGESNQPTADKYVFLLRALITNWRQAWGTKMPFLIVQNANVNERESVPIGRNQFPLIREGQLRALALENTALVVTIDIGSLEIHQQKKQETGKRLALAARGLVYGEAIPYSGPIYERMENLGQSIRLHFKHAQGLHSKGELAAFAIAGPDGQFQWGNAVIEGETIVVANSNIQNPVAVRYAWGQNPGACLYNQYGLPASPFRTDLPHE